MIFDQKDDNVPKQRRKLNRFNSIELAELEDEQLAQKANKVANRYMDVMKKEFMLNINSAE